MNVKATMADVARMAKVSPATASRVIHNNGYVSEENRKRVLDAVEAIGYRPNLQARSLRMQRSYSVGLVLSSARENPFFTHISHAIRTSAMNRGYSMLTVNHGYSSDAEATGVSQFLEHGVDAVVLCHGLDPKNFEPIKAAALPVIEIERHIIDGSSVIEIDPHSGMIEAVETLHRQGHRKIAFVGGKIPDDLVFSTPVAAEALRADAFCNAITASGLALDDCPVMLGDYNPSHTGGGPPGYVIGKELLKSGGPTAILTGSDILAAGVLQAIYERGLRVPDDISVIGYDDSIARLLAPPLTSIAQPYHAIGEEVMRLIEKSTSPSTEQTSASVATSLIERLSVGPIRLT
jgi:DNA-binding LacI/PurR family transcriptional regulator